MRLIDADAFIELLGDLLKCVVKGSDGKPKVDFGAVVCKVSQFCIIDPEDLRPKGRWEKHKNIRGFVYCSACRDVYLDGEWLADGKWTYCPNCGAKMEVDHETASPV